MNKLTRIASILAVMAFLSACANQQPSIASNISKEKGGWEIRIVDMYEDAEYVISYVRLSPAQGQQFVMAKVSIHNKSSSKKSLDLEKYLLAYDLEHAYEPRMIDTVSFIPLPSNSKIDLSPGEKITRNFLFPFPADKAPKYLITPQVGVIVIPEFKD